MIDEAVRARPGYVRGLYLVVDRPAETGALVRDFLVLSRPPTAGSW